jgi:hypothetical protein
MNGLSLRCPSCGKWLEVEDWEADNLTITIWAWCECGKLYNITAREVLGDDSQGDNRAT